MYHLKKKNPLSLQLRMKLKSSSIHIKSASSSIFSWNIVFSKIILSQLSRNLFHDIFNHLSKFLTNRWMKCNFELILFFFIVFKVLLFTAVSTNVEFEFSIMRVEFLTWSFIWWLKEATAKRTVRLWYKRFKLRQLAGGSCSYYLLRNSASIYV